MSLSSVSLSLLRELFPMQTSRNKLRKVCPQCSTPVHVKRAVCEYGYAFPSKRKAQSDSMLRAMEHKRVDRLHKANMRASETPEQTVNRQEEDKLCKSSMRASETHDQTVNRQKQSRAHMASMRASETHDQTVNRQKQDKLCKSSMRASETHDQTVNRQEQDKLRKARKRASETPVQVLQRQETNKERMLCKRSKCVSVEQAISAFHSEIKAGPDFVCTCCHRMMYKKTVFQCNKTKYTKASPDLLKNVFSANLSHISNDGKEWICKTCDRALARGSMPLQAKANGLRLPEIPPELSGLNALELRLISLRLPFMKMVALPSGKQRSIHGPAVNVPSKVDTICDVLPRLPSQCELVPMKLKCKVAYKGHYMYDYIRPQKLLDALKANNPL